MLQKITLPLYKFVPIPNTSNWEIDSETMLEHSIWAWVDDGFALHKIIIDATEQSVMLGDRWTITQMKTRRNACRDMGYDKDLAKEVFCELQRFEHAGLRLADMTHEQAKDLLSQIRDRFMRIIYPDTWFLEID